MKIINQLLNKICSLTVDKKTKIIAIGGAADLGKSHLCEELVQCLQQQGITANSLSLDSYLIPRHQRAQFGISGYEIRAYDIEEILKDLRSFQNGKPLQHHEYDHGEGRCVEQAKLIEPCTYLFLDGVQSLNAKFSEFVDASFFIYTSDEQLKAIRHEANLTKRKQSEAFSRNSSQMELQKYKEHVEPLKSKADIQLRLLNKWKYELQ